jgi:CubicO group peptidase (beta-lactamase class C family)
MTRCAAFAVGLLVCCGSARAQPTAATLDAARLAAFADAVLPADMAIRHIPGAVLVVVDAGAVALARGYGVADIAAQRRVDPDRTRFRLASVGKVITATAALQLVDQGRLSLTQDVNQVLRDFKLPAFGSKPVTLHDLLTHTAGFDERLTGMAVRSPDALVPLSSYLAFAMPPRFAEPGRVISYSNHGMSLVGLLVQEASGRPFEQYVREAIFRPLDMSRSDALDRDPPEDLATAYHWTGSAHRPLSPEYLQVRPAGTFYVTGNDIGRFLIAQLEGGAHDGTRILRAETVARMQSRQFAQHPALSGWGYGFWEDRHVSPRAVLHNGGGKGYKALIYLIPEQRVGIFLAYNLADRHEDGELLDAFIRQFREAFVPPTEPLASPSRSTQFDPTAVDAIVGHYRYVRRARHGPEQAIGLMNTVSIVGGAERRGLALKGLSRSPIGLTEIEPGVFRRADGLGSVAISRVNGGRAMELVLDRGGFPAVYDRVSWLLTLPVQFLALVTLCLAFVYTIVARLGQWRGLGLLHRVAPPDSVTSLDAVASSLNLVVVVALPLAWFGSIEGGFPEFVYGTPMLVRVLLWIPVLTAVFGVLSAVASWRAWRTGAAPRSPIRRAGISIALLAFSALAGYWGLIGAVN